MDIADPYLTVEQVAERLGLPVSLLVRRLEAGDVPARKVDGPEGPVYRLRLSDLGIEPAGDDDEDLAELELTGTARTDDGFGGIGRSPAMIAPVSQGPLADVASMSIDPRELVAGLLDRWERTLEQRIYAEQRQRFESELLARQTMVKQLQMELKTARAEQAAIASDKDRIIAERNHAIADVQRELDAARTQLQETTAKRRGWFRR